MTKHGPRMIHTQAETLDDALDALGAAAKTSIAKGRSVPAKQRRRTAAKMSEQFNRRPVYLKNFRSAE